MPKLDYDQFIHNDLCLQFTHFLITENNQLFELPADSYICDMLTISEPDIVDGNFKYLKRYLDRQIRDYNTHGTHPKPVLFIRCERTGHVFTAIINRLEKFVIVFDPLIASSFENLKYFLIIISLIIKLLDEKPEAYRASMYMPSSQLANPFCEIYHRVSKFELLNNCNESTKIEDVINTLCNIKKYTHICPFLFKFYNDVLYDKFRRDYEYIMSVKSFENIKVDASINAITRFTWFFKSISKLYPSGIMSWRCVHDMKTSIFKKVLTSAYCLCCKDMQNYEITFFEGGFNLTNVAGSTVDKYIINSDDPENYIIHKL